MGSLSSSWLLLIGVFLVIIVLFSSFWVCSSHLSISEGVGVLLLEGSPSEEYVDSTGAPIRSGWVP